MRILVNRTDAIGDSILTSVIAKLIKEKYPDSHITFIVSPRCEPLFTGHPYIDEIMVWEESVKGRIRNFFNFFLKIKKSKVSTYMYFGGSHTPSFIAWLLRVKIRGGLKSKPVSFLFLNKGIRQKRSLVEMHEADYNMHLLESLDIEYDYSLRDKYQPIIGLQRKEISEAYQHFIQDVKDEGLIFKEKIIFIHPGMMGHTLNWAPKNYARIILRIENKSPNKYLFVISHTPGDKEYFSGVKIELEKNEYEKVRNRTYYFDGSIKGLRNYMSVLARASLYIGPSTGTTHIANILAIKVVTLYSPIKVQSVLRWGPFNRDHSRTRVLVPDVICGEQFFCQGLDCPYYECMTKIEVDDVVMESMELLELGGSKK